MSQTREIITRLGELTKIREFEVCDGSSDQIVSLTLWDIEWIRLADKWEPKNTILFLADAQVSFNEKSQKSMLTIGKFYIFQIVSLAAIIIIFFFLICIY